MKTGTTITVIMLAWASSMPLQAHESEHKLDVPGFRPLTESAAEFVQSAEASKVAVFPSIVRVVKPSEDKVEQGHSKDALNRVVEYLEVNKLGTAEISDIEFEIGEAPRKGQFALFNHTIESIGKQLDGYKGDADYFLVLDIIRVQQKAWGIQCYVLDHSGRNVFSFLLNSHHKSFVDAGIRMQDDTEESRKKIVTDCTELALESLGKQVELAREIAAYKPDPQHTGKYIRQNNPDDHVEFRTDGSFVGMKDGNTITGTYAVVHGNACVLTFPGEVQMPVGELKNGAIHDYDGEVWLSRDD